MPHSSSLHPQFSKPLDQNPPYDSLQDQQKSTYPQGPVLQYPSHQEPQTSQVTQTVQNYQSLSQTDPPIDTRRVSKLQIPTNPRIASNLTFGLPKADKESSSANATKPAYISVSLPKSDDTTPPNADTDSMLKVRIPINCFCACMKSLFDLSLIDPFQLLDIISSKQNN